MVNEQRAGSSDRSNVISTTAETFENDVWETSKKVPVVVDFWAPWCQPCRMLGPLLEKAVEAFQGRVLLVKANTDELPEAAAAFGVQGIPAVFAVWQGAIIASFVGLLPEDRLREWLQRVVTDVELHQARQAEESDRQQARQIYRRLRAEQPKLAEAAIGLARLALQEDDYATAQQLLDELLQRGYLEPEAEKIRAALELHAKQQWDVDALRRHAQQNPTDSAAQIRLAEALAAHEQYAEALQILLSVVEREHGALRDQARQAMLTIFRALPDDSPLTAEYRRRLAAALY